VGHLVEFRFDRTEADAAALDAILRSAPGFSGDDPESGRYHYRAPGRANDGDPTPDVEVWGDERGLHCNFLGGDASHARRFQDHLRAALGARFGPIREVY